MKKTIIIDEQWNSILNTLIAAGLNLDSRQPQTFMIVLGCYGDTASVVKTAGCSAMAAPLTDTFWDNLECKAPSPKLHMDSWDWKIEGVPQLPKRPHMILAKITCQVDEWPGRSDGSRSIEMQATLEYVSSVPQPPTYSDQFRSHKGLLTNVHRMKCESMQQAFEEFGQDYDRIETMLVQQPETSTTETVGV